MVPEVLMSEVLPEMASLGRSATDKSVQPGLITVGLMKDPNKMHIQTFDVSGKPAKQPFHTACFRDQ